MTTRFSPVTVAQLALALALAACSSNNSSTAKGASSCGEAAAAVCAKEAACLGPFFNHASVADCTASISQSCSSAAADPNTGFTASWFGTCASAYNSASCAEVAQYGAPAACNSPPGKLAVGGACSNNGDCASSLCTIAAGASCGVCAAAQAAGSPCTPGGACSTGLTCNMSNVCIATVALGGACTPSDTCSEGACVSGKCTISPLAAAGATCSTGYGSGAGPECDPAQSLQCVAATAGAATGTCMKGPTAAPNAACSYGTPGVADTICTGGSTCNGSTCVLPLTQGQACGSAIPNNYCGGNLVCMPGDAGSSTCQPYTPPVCK